MTKHEALKKVDELFKESTTPERTTMFTSTTPEAPVDERLESIILPDSKRAKMPLTKEKYLIRENPQLVQWEREVRKFVKKLGPANGHRISAVMVYEWATGLNVADLMKEGKSAAPDLRKINQVLKHYFGNSYQTWIAGRKVGKAYKVPPGYRVIYRAPMTLTLWAEHRDGTLKA